MSLRDAWEANAEDWLVWARTPGHDSYWHFHRDAFLALVPQPGALTVDVGCGEGRLSRDLRARGHRVISLDASPTLLAAAREADPEGEYVQAEASDLPLADSVADLVVAFMSLQDVDEMPLAVSEIGRVLQPAGRLCLAIVHPLNSAGAFVGDEPDSPFTIEGSYMADEPYVDVFSRDGLTMTFHSRHRPLEAFSRALEDAGLLIETLREPPAHMPEEYRTERRKRWLRIPLFLHLRAVKPG